MKKKKEVIGTLYQELTCPACGKLYSNPYLLPCNHSLCDTCLSKEIKHEKKGQICIKCPSCKESFCFNQEDEVKFPENYLLNNTVTRYRQEAFNANTENAKKKKRNAKGRINPQQTQILCQLCDEKDNHIAMKKCVNCNLNFCDKCLRKIHKNKAFLSHVLIDPSSYTDDQIKCFYHPFTNLKHYCVQDNLPICDECKLSTHRNHRLYSLDLAFQCEVAEMQKNVSRFVEVKANYEKCFQQLKLMKTNIELNAMQRTAEVTKEFNFLQEALKLQEQTIKDIMKSENTKKQNEVDNFIESASKLMLQLEGLILYAMEAFKETSPAVFLQTSAQINKRLTESMLYVTPSKSLAVIPFEDFEFNVDHLKDAINALSSQICGTASEYLCSEDFQKIQALNVPNKMKKLKVTGNIHEILPNLYCPSFTSKVHASLTSPKLDLCSCISRSCTAAFSLDEHNSDFHTNVSSSSECRPKCASENNVTISSTYVDSCSHVADSSICNSEYTSKPDATSNETLTDSSTYVKCSSKHSAPKMDVNSNAPNMICCESLPNFEHHNLQYDSETPLSKNQTFPLLCCSKSDTSISPGGICKCIEIPEFKDANNTLCNASGIDPCQNTSTTPTKILHIDRNQESGDCQSPTEITKFMCISGNTISAWQCQQQFNNESVISGFNVDVHQKEIYFSNRISSPKTADGKHPINNDSLDLLKDHTISSHSGVLPDSDTGNNSSYNSLCLPLGRENGESTSPLSQLIAPCTFTNAEPPQADYVQNGSEDFGKSTCSKDEKGISSNCVVSDGSSKSQMSNNACSSFSSVRSHGEFGNNLCCKSLNSSCERKCSVETTHNSQNQQQYSSDGCKMDFREQKVHCSLGTKSNSAKTHSFTNSDISKPLQFWNTNNIVHNTRSRHRFGGQSYYRNPKLLTKSKSFVRSNHKSQTGCNVRFSQSAQYQSQSTTNFEINSNTPTEDSIKSHSSNHLYSIHFPRTQPLRNGHCTCPKLRPQSGIHISTDHKKQCHAYTSKNKITVNKGTRNDPLLSQMNNVILTCNVGKLQLFDNRVQFDTENNETAQISSHHFLNEPLNALSQELSEAPTIYKHTVDGTSAKVKWLFPAEEHTVFFFELQFQEIISIDKEMAIPQYQAGVFSGIRRTNFVATNLNTNSEYLFRVRAVNVTGKGPWSQPYKILTVRGTMHHDMDTKEDAVSIKGVKVTIRRSS